MKNHLGKVKTLTIVILMVLLASCYFLDEPKYCITPSLANHVEKFFNEAIERGIILKRENLIVRISDKSESKTRGFQRIVSISQTEIDYFSKDNQQYSIEALVAHELGHALLNLEHSKDISLMNYDYTYSSLFSKECVKDLYYDQLFLKRKLTDAEIWTVFNSCDN